MLYFAILRISQNINLKEENQKSETKVIEASKHDRKHEEKKLDMKMNRVLIYKIGFLSVFILPILLVGGYYQGGVGYFYPLLFAFVLVPLADYFIGEDRYNLSKEQEKEVSAERYYSFIIHVWTYLQLLLVVWSSWVVAQKSNWLWFEWVGFTLSTGVVTGGIGITVAHELGHRSNRYEQFMAKLILMTVCYMHFFIAHNLGHHTHVGTPQDPTTAHRNESFYRFWIRSVFGNFFQAWKIEKSLLQRKGRSVISYHNRMLWYTTLPIVFLVFVFLVVSLVLKRAAWEVIGFFFAQSFVAFSLLEFVNYIEHYGLQRQKLSNGRYERVNSDHSWNSSYILSNLLLLQLQRHSDHHTYANRPYQILRHFDESPQLPAGYPTMILIASVPPLWFRIMNARLDKWKNNRETTLKQSLNK